MCYGLRFRTFSYKSQIRLDFVGNLEIQPGLEDSSSRLIVALSMCFGLWKVVLVLYLWSPIAKLLLSWIHKAFCLDIIFRRNSQKKPGKVGSSARVSFFLIKPVVVDPGVSIKMGTEFQVQPKDAVDVICYSPEFYGTFCPP